MTRSKRARAAGKTAAPDEPATRPARVPSDTGAAKHAAVLAHCRVGFEGECAGEMQQRATLAGIGAWCVAEQGAARVLCVPAESASLGALATALPLACLVFARDRCVVGAELPELPERRVEALVSAVATTGRRYGELRMETADNDECRPLLPLCRKLSAPLAGALREAGLLDAGDAAALPRQRGPLPRLHIHLLASRRARIGYCDPGEGSAWPMGIPRLRAPRGAPSRSALKLEEALHVLLPMLRGVAPPAAGMSAVDLGAAPGGWSLVLANRELQVTAVDNGPLAAVAAGHAGIEHVRADGFHYRPSRPVHWLVCDMVESPSRVAELVGKWFAQGWCGAALFNLKLPMKKRLQEVQTCLETLRRATATPMLVTARQLYHDREEITVLAVPNRR